MHSVNPWFFLNKTIIYSLDNDPVLIINSIRFGNRNSKGDANADASCFPTQIKRIASAFFTKRLTVKQPGCLKISALVHTVSISK